MKKPAGLAFGGFQSNFACNISRSRAGIQRQAIKRAL
jgi:hypothetical protein